LIRYALVCEHDHEFEGWFGSSSDYDDQAERGLVQCPMCASAQVRKQIMAPAVAGTKKRSMSDTPPQKRVVMMEAVRRVRQHVEETFDYVGDTFAKEARAIHEGTSEERGIYGEATPQEVRDLVKDGVPVAPLPPEPPKKDEVN
jgi:hypothetical protein